MIDTLMGLELADGGGAGDDRGWRPRWRPRPASARAGGGPRVAAG